MLSPRKFCPSPIERITPSAAIIREPMFFFLPSLFFTTNSELYYPCIILRNEARSRIQIIVAMFIIGTVLFNYLDNIRYRERPLVYIIEWPRALMPNSTTLLHRHRYYHSLYKRRPLTRRRNMHDDRKSNDLTRRRVILSRIKSRSRINPRSDDSFFRFSFVFPIKNYRKHDFFEECFVRVRFRGIDSIIIVPRVGGTSSATRASATNAITDTRT